MYYTSFMYMPNIELFYDKVISNSRLSAISRSTGNISMLVIIITNRNSRVKIIE